MGLDPVAVRISAGSHDQAHCRHSAVRSAFSHCGVLLWRNRSRVSDIHSYRLLQSFVLSCGEIPAGKQGVEQRLNNQPGITTLANKLQDLIYATTGIELGLSNEPVVINAQIAVASLLAVAASSDGSIDGKETVKMVEALCGRFSITSTVALDFVTTAIDDQLIQRDPSQLFDELNQRLTLKQKEELILMLLEVIAADGEKDAGEMAVLDRTVSALNISDNRLAKIYQRYFESRRNSGA